MSARCKGCGKEIVWGTLAGRAIPLDPRAPTYDVIVSGESPSIGRSQAMVSHFATCSKVMDFAKVSSREAALAAALTQAMTHVPEDLRGQPIFVAGQEAINASLQARGITG